MAVYRFRVKGNGSVGVVKYTDGMNIEVTDLQARKGDNPFNTRTKKILFKSLQANTILNKIFLQLLQLKQCSKEIDLMYKKFKRLYQMRLRRP